MGGLRGNEYATLVSARTAVEAKVLVTSGCAAAGRPSPCSWCAPAASAGRHWPSAWTGVPARVLGDEADAIQLVSAGTQGVVGSAMHLGSALVLRGFGAEAGDFVARRLTPAIAADADLVLTMTRRPPRRGDASGPVPWRAASPSAKRPTSSVCWTTTWTCRARPWLTARHRARRPWPRVVSVVRPATTTCRTLSGGTPLWT